MDSTGTPVCGACVIAPHPHTASLLFFSSLPFPSFNLHKLLLLKRMNSIVHKGLLD